MNQSAVDLLVLAERRGGALLLSDVVGRCKDRSYEQVRNALLQDETLAECLKAGVLRMVEAEYVITIVVTPTGEDYLDAMRAPDVE